MFFFAFVVFSVLGADGFVADFLSLQPILVIIGLLRRGFLTSHRVSLGLKRRH